jgi:hypothetical protein
MKFLSLLADADIIQQAISGPDNKASMPQKNLPFWRLGFPYFIARPRTPMERLRAYGVRRGFDGLGRRKRALLRLGMAIGWPLATFVDSLRYSGQFHALKRTGRVRAFLDLYSSALLRNVPPEQWLRFSARHREGNDAIAQYLFPMDIRALDALNRSRAAPVADVQDKVRFADLCGAHALPHVNTLAAFRNGAPVESAGSVAALAESVFVKPIAGKGGAGAQVWRFEGGVFVSASSERLTPQALAAALSREDCIVQPLIRGGAVSNLRLVTAIARSGKAVAIAATIIIDNDIAAITSQNGRLYGIDLSTGAINRAFDMGQIKDLSSIHIPVEDPLVGATLPFWHEAVELAVRAHETAFPRFISLGWDIVLSDAGPVLIEANQGWGAGVHQLLDGAIGHSGLSHIVDESLQWR